MLIRNSSMTTSDPVQPSARGTLEEAFGAKQSKPALTGVRDACVVIPAYNERGHIVRLIEAIAEGCSADNPRVLVMDDGSPDGTADAVDGLKSRFPNAVAVRRSGDRGYGKAIV